MTDKVPLWARVEITSNGLVNRYMMFINETTSTGDLCSTNLGGANFDTPETLDQLPECLADAVRVMVMRRRNLEGFGVWVERKGNGAVLWVYSVFATPEEFKTFSRSKSWLYAPEAGEKVFREILDKLNPMVCTEGSN